MSKSYSVAIVGATGAVGTEFLNLFELRNFPVGTLRLLASSRSIGKPLNFQGKECLVEEVTDTAFECVDVAFFSAGASRSLKYAPVAVKSGALVIDNSSAFRMDPNVPLIIPEVNIDDVQPGNRIIAVPNCSAIILLMAVNPLRKLGAVRRLIVSTYQSASGGGASMMRELEDQTRANLSGQSIKSDLLQEPYAFNLFSHNTEIGADGYNGEELKVIAESKKILGMPDLKVNVTCVRVPVLRAHSLSVTVEFEGDCPCEEQVREVLERSPGVRVIDDREHNHFPTPHKASGQWDVLVGRIRRDLSDSHSLCMFVSGDQLLKGAALNAVQIAEQMLGIAASAQP